MQEIFFIGIALIAVGIVILLIHPLIEYHRIFHKGIPVDAFVCGRKEKVVRRKKRVKLIWQYTYEGEDRQYVSRYWQPENEKGIGYRGALLLKKTNTEKIYEFIPLNQKVMFRILGTVIGMAGLILIAVFAPMRGSIELLNLK